MALKISLPIQSVVGFPITALPFDGQIRMMIQWAKQRTSRTVCVANVHMLMEAYSSSEFASILIDADLVTPDGMPLVWLMNFFGKRQDRVAGMDILCATCRELSVHNISAFFVGSEPEILQQMKVRLNREFPDLKIAGMEPLPFRPLTPAEDKAIVDKINQSGAGIVFVSLGCPKQEIWMSQHRNRIHAVMVGLGGVFPVYAGIHKRAPGWIRQIGCEWLYRLIQEPRRLWKRYFTTIPPFLYLAAKQLAKFWLGKTHEAAAIIEPRTLDRHARV